jgi:hypothetical protein
VIALILSCLASFGVLVSLARQGQRLSLGLPIAYLYLLLLIHLPGAFAHVAGRDFLLNYDIDEIAMRFTTLGTACFVLGVWWARASLPEVKIRTGIDRRRFWIFCRRLRANAFL